MADDGECPCEPLWTQSPGSLLKFNFGTMDLCESNNINAFSRAFVVTTLVAIVTAPFLGWGGAAVL